MMNSIKVAMLLDMFLNIMEHCLPYFKSFLPLNGSSGGQLGTLLIMAVFVSEFVSLFKRPEPPKPPKLPAKKKSNTRR